jgi:hypothetical protein
LIPFTQIRSGIDGCDAHLAHIPSDRFPIDAHPFSLQLCRNFPSTVKGALRVDFINAMLQPHFYSTGRARLVIEARAAQTEQISLQIQRKLTLCPLNQRDPFLSRQICTFF